MQLKLFLKHIVLRKQKTEQGDATMNHATMQFDNHDEQIKYYELLLERDLDDLPRFPLPDGYRFGFYKLSALSLFRRMRETAGTAGGL